MIYIGVKLHPSVVISEAVYIKHTVVESPFMDE